MAVMAWLEWNCLASRIYARKVYTQLAQSCLNFRSSQKIFSIQTSTLNKTFMEQITCT